ncbi:DUF4913 domain-containing protein [Streptomyces hygroscopicus]|uniref:DUF4913 domain-containing protein n=1 Tax=Streptomyces hygroscopicus TaxID=1912 RepID=UPI0007679B76|nr:DUF4913 domain-containing protein [Streptomyces hygroscopicus]
MSDPAADSTNEPVRVAEHDLDDLAATVKQLVMQTTSQRQMLERLSDESSDISAFADVASAEAADNSNPAPEATGEPTPTSVFILALDDEAYRIELEALSAWVNHLLLPVYGREITTHHPWCHQWHEHPEAVARLHALWLAWQQFTDTEAGLAGPSIWHRDHLDPTSSQLRAPDGPFAACTTNPNRPHHRLLPHPAPATAPGV